MPSAANFATMRTEVWPSSVTLRAALAAAVVGGDWATADGLLQLLRSAERPPAEVVDLAARRRG